VHQARENLYELDDFQRRNLARVMRSTPNLTHSRPKPIPDHDLAPLFLPFLRVSSGSRKALRHGAKGEATAVWSR
jgi:hypothetical protein